MRNIWFISDTHFGHENIIGYCRPQFSSLAEMEQRIIDEWNSRVRPDDLIYHLGDFAWSTQDAKRVRPLLHGTIRLIAGNHDDIPGLVKGGLFQKVELWRQFRDQGFTATHIPMRADQLRHGVGNVHGHVHGKSDSLEAFHFDVSVEATDYGPIHLDDIARWARVAKDEGQSDARKDR